MTDSIDHPTTVSRMPSHYVYHPIKTKDPQPYYRRIGTAWAHGDGKGFNVQLESLPLDGRVQLRVPNEKAE
jgi:hypothetical protein